MKLSEIGRYGIPTKKVIPVMLSALILSGCATGENSKKDSREWNDCFGGHEDYKIMSPQEIQNAYKHHPFSSFIDPYVELSMTMTFCEGDCSGEVIEKMERMVTDHNNYFEQKKGFSGIDKPFRVNEETKKIEFTTYHYDGEIITFSFDIIPSPQIREKIKEQNDGELDPQSVRRDHNLLYLEAIREQVTN